MEPVTCSLTTKQAAVRLLEWSDVRSIALSVTAIVDGVEIIVPLDELARVRDLAVREGACCSFLTITVDACDDTAVLRITAPTAEGQQVIAAFAPTS